MLEWLDNNFNPNTEFGCNFIKICNTYKILFMIPNHLDIESMIYASKSYSIAFYFAVIFFFNYLKNKGEGLGRR